MSHSRDAARLGRTGTPVLDTAQALRGMDKFSAGWPTSAQTLGANAAGDGGGGLWRWDSASAATDNLGTVLLPTGSAVAGRWVREYSGAVNVQWFGAIPDGTTNVAPAIQAALNATTTGVLFPASSSSYHCTNGLIWPNGVSWYGEGSQWGMGNPDTSRLTFVGNFNAISNDQTSRMVGEQMKDLYLDCSGNSGAGTWAVISLWRAQRMVFENLRIMGGYLHTRYGIVMYGNDNGKTHTSGLGVYYNILRNVDIRSDNVPSGTPDPNSVGIWLAGGMIDGERANLNHFERCHLDRWGTYIRFDNARQTMMLNCKCSTNDPVVSGIYGIEFRSGLDWAGVDATVMYCQDNWIADHSFDSKAWFSGSPVRFVHDGTSAVAARAAFFSGCRSFTPSSDIQIDTPNGAIMSWNAVGGVQQGISGDPGSRTSLTSDSRTSLRHSVSDGLMSIYGQPGAIGSQVLLGGHDYTSTVMAVGPNGSASIGIGGATDAAFRVVRSADGINFSKIFEVNQEYSQLQEGIWGLPGSATSVAAAAAITLVSTNSRITGSATISTLTAPDGAMVIIRGTTAGTVTLTTGGNIYLEGGLDIVLNNVRDIALFFFAGSEAFELSRSLQ